MQTFYVTTLEAQTKMSNELLPHVTKCTCGYSLAYIDEKKQLSNCNVRRVSRKRNPQRKIFLNIKTETHT